MFILCVFIFCLSFTYSTSIRNYDHVTNRAVALMANELRQLVDRANAPIFGIDSDGNVNEWNEMTAEITGFTGDYALGKPLVETFIIPKLQKSVQNILTQALNGNETSNYELEFCTASDETRYLLVNVSLYCKLLGSNLCLLTKCVLTHSSSHDYFY